MNEVNFSWTSCRNEVKMWWGPGNHAGIMMKYFLCQHVYYLKKDIFVKAAPDLTRKKLMSKIKRRSTLTCLFWPRYEK